MPSIQQGAILEQVLNSHIWLTNHFVTEDSPFRAVPVELVPPVLLPEHHSGHGILFKRDGPSESLVKYALRHKISLPASCLAKICHILKIKLGTGTGKNGHLVKKDYYARLLQHFFPDEPDLQQELIEQLTSTAKSHHELDSPPEAVLQHLMHLDSEAQVHFQELKEEAEKQKRESAIKAAVNQALQLIQAQPKAAEATELDKQNAPAKGKEFKEEHHIMSDKCDKRNMTPTHLRHLLPDLKMCYLQRNPARKTYQAHYPEGYCSIFVFVVSLL